MDREGRRTFLLTCLGGVAALGAGGFILPVLSFLSPRAQEEAAGKVAVPLQEIPPGAARYFQYHGSPAVLVRGGDGRFFAFSAVCTHLGCVVQWQEAKREFLCPCHAGRFSAEGKVLSGPPPLPLPQLPVAVENNSVMVG